MSLDQLTAQYEAFPYPARDPRDETKRLITGSPSHLDEVNHYVFAGRLDHRRPLRVLVAGGGTGDGTIQIAQQMASTGNPGRVVYLDLSAAARQIAEARAATRGLTNIEFRTGSLLEPGDETYDYIDCCGVLHHLPDPAAGLTALAARLDAGGGMGIMVYAPLGRTGVYPMQNALRTLTQGLPLKEQVALARRALAGLPKTNWLLNNPHISDHRGPDADLYDLLLHSCDRPFTVTELGGLAASAGLSVAALISPAAYDPANWIKDPRLLKRLEGLDFLAKAALAEQLSGAMTKHVAYLTRPERLTQATARPDGPDAIPVLRDIDGPALAKALPANGVLEIDLLGSVFPLALPRLAGPILRHIDGVADLTRIHAQVAAAAGGGLTWEAFKTQFDRLYSALNGFNKMLIRRPPP
ncbi:MAG TPA: class I SAM-dependent methyltransferase [Azospirillaceae bacterium]|nr:class I SAM-dependent methyltransferase [Azospirillaceae bacterium]HRQ80471.1 class I SAM-dependent methyltransferase [Azospirillaceae bacterium]